MEISWIRYFYEVARLGSVTQAARHLSISQPAVTKMIRQLESSLGYQPFSKVGRRLVLTAEGERLFRHTRELMRKWDEIQSLHHQLDTQLDATLRLGLSDNLAIYVLPKIVRKMLKEHPRLKWSLYSGSSHEIKMRVLNGELQAGVFYTDLSLREKSELQEYPLLEVPFVAVTHPNSGVPKKINKLKSHGGPYIGMRSIDYQNTLPEQWIVKRLGLGQGAVIEATSKEVQKQIVLQGIGFGVFPLLMVKKEVDAKQLTVIQGSQSHLGVRLVINKDSVLTPVLQKLRAELKSALERQNPS